jgi:transcriptional regulator with XRE-family HTH domain
MIVDHVAEWIVQPRNVPNNLTWAIGEKIRDASQEAGLTQAELAERVHRRQAAISQIENGKMLLDAETLVYLAGVLDKPIRYFFPDALLPRFEGELRNWEREYLENIRALPPSDRQRIAEYTELLAAAAQFERQQIREKLREQFNEMGLFDQTSQDESVPADLDSR